MDQHKIALPVLARFPDLNDGTHHSEHNRTTGLGLLTSSGRLIGQTLSVKLLAGTALFLLVGAVLPFCIGKNPPPADSSPAGTATAQHQSAETTPESPRAVRLTVAEGTSSAPAVLSPLPDTNGKLQPSPASDSPLMSRSTPDNPQPTGCRGRDPQPGVDRPAIPRPAEYEADSRGNSSPWNDPETRR